MVAALLLVQGGLPDLIKFDQVVIHYSKPARNHTKTNYNLKQDSFMPQKMVLVSKYFIYIIINGSILLETLDLMEIV